MTFSAYCKKKTLLINYNFYCLNQINKNENSSYDIEQKNNCANKWCTLTGRVIWPSSNLVPAHKCGDRLQCSVFLLYKRVLYCGVVTCWNDEV
jgi:hypothetical protein